MSLNSLANLKIKSDWWALLIRSKLFQTQLFCIAMKLNVTVEAMNYSLLCVNSIQKQQSTQNTELLNHIIHDWWQHVACTDQKAHYCSTRKTQKVASSKFIEECNQIPEWRFLVEWNSTNERAEFCCLNFFFKLNYAG